MPTLRTPSKWVVAEHDPHAVDQLQVELKVSSVVAKVLVARGLTDPEAAYRFLNPSIEELHDPRLLPDYLPAVTEILGARERKEKIYVHGDYDVDGVTSATLFARFLISIGCDVDVRVPHRMKHGYGVHEEAVHDAQRKGAKLLLTCDCGVSAHSSITMAKELGLRVVVTDHHTVGETLPADASAVVNPHRADSQYPFSDLCGAGVAFKLCEGLTSELGLKKQQFTRAFLDLAALGTISDIMPLVGENRILTYFGLKELSQTRKPGLIALKEVANIGADVTAYDAGWKIGPRLNAAGRIEDAALSLRLLMTQDEKEAKNLARTLDDINKERRLEEARIVEEAIQRVEAEKLHERPVIFLIGDDWHLGIVGLVAGRLVERFRRPAFVLNSDEAAGTAKGSGRSIEGFDLSHIIHHHSDRFLSGGGHAMAAGCTIELDRASEIRSLFEGYAQEVLTEESYVKKRKIDAEVGAGELTLTDLHDLAMLEPTGASNPSPSFAARGLEIVSVKIGKTGEHAHLTVRYPGGVPFRVNAWRAAEEFSEVEPGTNADFAFHAGINEWNGNMSVEWKLNDYNLY